MFDFSLIHALPIESRRGIDRKEAASYIGVSPTHFDKLVRKGLMPAPMQLLGRKVWDVKTLDLAVDAHSGLDSGKEVSEQNEAYLDRELAAFEAKHG